MILIFVSGAFFINPLKSEAFGYGGYNVLPLPCVCSAATVWWVWYWPLLPWSPFIGGPLAVGIPPLTVWFLNFVPIVPTTWSLGNFIPFAQTCWQPTIITGCAFMPVLGHVYMVGSSPPLSIP